MINFVPLLVTAVAGVVLSGLWSLTGRSLP